jgi:preprotein translocase subunit YajC
VILAALLAQTSTKNTNSGFGIIIIPLMLVVFYFILIRPQRNRMKQHQQLLGTLGVDDEVETIGGVIGTIRGATDDEFLLEIAPGTTIRVSRGAVRRKLYQPEEEVEEQETPDSNP